jgi:hypothetical protein
MYKLNRLFKTTLKILTLEKMKYLISFILSASFCFAQIVQRGLHSANGLSLGSSGLNQIQNSELQYGININGGFTYVPGILSYNLSPDGSSNLFNTTTWMGIDANTKGYYIFDSVYLANISPAKDLSGNGNDGTLVGNFPWSGESRKTGGKSLYFNGNSFIQLPPQDITSSFTAELWLKVGTIDQSKNEEIILSQHPADGLHNFFIFLSNQGIIAFKSVGAGGGVISSPISYTDNKWHYVVAVFNAGASQQLYIDGELIGSLTLSGISITNTRNMYIGDLDGNGTFGRFKGFIQEVRLTARGLTATEIKNYYNNFTEDYNIWTIAGNHTITSDLSNPYDGTFGGKIISMGVGDGTNNFVSLPISSPLVSGEKYVVVINAKAAYANNKVMTVQIGNNSKTINLTSSWTKTIYHFRSFGENEIKVFLSQADTAFIDFIQIKKQYDYLMMAWTKSNGVGIQGIFNTVPYNLRLLGGHVDALFSDEFGNLANVSLLQPYDTSKWNLIGSYIDWTGNCGAFLNSNVSITTLHQGLGSVVLPANSGRIFDLGGTPQYSGKFGAVAIYRFDDISLSDFNLSNLVDSATTNSMARITGGGANLVAFWDFAGDINHYLFNKNDPQHFYYADCNNLLANGVDYYNRILIGTKYSHPFTLPTVTTYPSSNITSTSADVGGIATTSDIALITDKGVCLSSLHSNPTIYDTIISAGTGDGSFVSSLSSLSASTLYHYRAYATNIVGTSYGGDSTFTTLMTPFQDETKNHLARVKADGGVVYDSTGLDAFIVRLKKDFSFTSCKAIYDPDWGIKKDGLNHIIKMYNVVYSASNPDLIQPDTTLAPKMRNFLNNVGTPTLRNSIYLDGSNDYMNTVQTPAWTQPAEVIMGIRLVSWTNFDNLIDGYDDNHRMTIYQGTTIPQIAIYGGTELISVLNNLDVGSFGVISAKYNYANSSYQVNNFTPAKGNVGTLNCNGLTLGARFDGLYPGNTETGTIIIGSFTAYQETNIKILLYSRWGIVISPVSLNLTVLLEAMYESGGTEMTTTPLVTVELHDASTYEMIESQSETLSSEGVGTFNFKAALNGLPYFIVIKDANSVETWSATANSFTSDALSYDFTTGLDKAYSDGSNPPLVLHGGKYCIYSGDVNQDGFVTGDDFQFIDNNSSLFVQRQVPH